MPEAIGAKPRKHASRSPRPDRTHAAAIGAGNWASPMPIDAPRRGCRAPLAMNGSGNVDFDLRAMVVERPRRERTARTAQPEARRPTQVARMSPAVRFGRDEVGCRQTASRIAGEPHRHHVRRDGPAEPHPARRSPRRSDRPAPRSPSSSTSTSGQARRKEADERLQQRRHGPRAAWSGATCPAGRRPSSPASRLAATSSSKAGLRGRGTVRRGFGQPDAARRGARNSGSADARFQHADRRLTAGGDTPSSTAALRKLRVPRDAPGRLRRHRARPISYRSSGFMICRHGRR